MKKESKVEGGPGAKVETATSKRQPFSTPTAEYFTGDMEARISSLSREKMMQLLFQLEQTEYWPALLRYSRERMSFVEETLFTADPVKEPSSISRTQGILIGLSDLQNGVIQLVLERQESLKENEEGIE
jgi:hypothetical protein